MNDIHFILKKYWGFDEFRTKQEAIIRSVLNGDDTLALLPTGGGKSICYQVPALAQPGICLVVSPLIALMKDQVENLKKRGIGALLIFSGMQRKDIIRTLENARDDYFKFLYVSPERIETSLFKEYLPALRINLIAVDEAHCISQWGYDFRPSYLRIADLREELPDVPILAVTASATPDVQKDICEKLSINKQGSGNIQLSAGWKIYLQDFERKNLSYSVFKVDSKINKLIEILKKVNGSSIVYCKSRKRTHEIASLLQMHGINSSNYHAGLLQEERNKRQEDWVNNKIRVIVCTNAFGMGIDKADVRSVIHVDVPDCLENYYQEAGRCGRDGIKAYAVLLFDDQDIKELLSLHLTRFPSFAEIKNVYRSLTNYLQIPVYTGQDESFDFHFDEFIRNFKLKAHPALYALKALEQDGWIDYNEKNFTPSTVVFTTTREGLNDFYQHHPQLENLATTLLRSYDGIFNFPAFISEAFLVTIVKLPVEEIKKQLLIMAAFGIIRYQPQKDNPQIFFKKIRIATEDLTLDLHQYNKRKELFIRRVKKITSYLQIATCRSQYISSYFGESSPPLCGICDNCLQQKKVELSTEEFNVIAATIREQITQKQLNIQGLIDELKLYKKEKTWKVLQFLQAEKKVTIDRTGLLVFTL